MDEEVREKHYNVYDVDGFWKDKREMSPESFDEAVGIYVGIDEVILGKDIIIRERAKGEKR